MPGYTPERVTSNSADLPEVSLAMVGMSDGADHIKHLGGGEMVLNILLHLLCTSIPGELVR